LHSSTRDQKSSIPLREVKEGREGGKGGKKKRICRFPTEAQYSGATGKKKFKTVSHTRGEVLTKKREASVKMKKGKKRPENKSIALYTS